MANTAYDPDTEDKRGQGSSVSTGSSGSGTRISFSGGGSSFGASFKPSSTSATASQLKNNEEKGLYNPYGDKGGASEGGTTGSSTSGKLKSREESPNDSTDNDKDGGLWSQPKTSKSTNNKRGRFKFSKRKIVVGSTVASIVLGGGGFFTLTTVSGPLQLIHLSETLQNNLSSTESASSSRTSKLFRFAPKEIGETRVGLLGRHWLRGTLDDMSKIGIEFQKNGLGGLRSTTIDPKKLGEKYPELKDMSVSQQKSWLSKNFGGLPVDQISFNEGKFTVGGTDFSLKATTLLRKKSIALLDTGKAQTGLKNRLLGKYFDQPGLFSPLGEKKAAGKLHSKLSSRELKAEQEREARLTAATEAKADASVKNIEDESNKYNSVVMKSLLFTGGACFVRSVSGDITTVNRNRVVLPAVIRAMDIIALGAKAKAGKASLVQLGAAIKGLTGSDGKTIWQAKSLQATQGKSNPGGVDMPEDIKQAFSPNTKANTMKEWANNSLGGDTIASGLCSPLGQIGQIAVSLIASAASAFGEVASGGTLTPAIVGIWAAKESASFAVTAVAMHFVETFILNKTASAKLAKDAFSGPLGGNLLAYGARTGFSIADIAGGAIPLSGSAASALAYQSEAQDLQQFKSESVFNQMFDAKDYRSLTGRAVDSINPSITQNINSLAANITNFSGLFSSLSSLIMPKTQAASLSYQWSFPQYGIPLDILNDPNMADPYDNADKVAGIMTGSQRQSYKDKAKDCFGVDINNDSGSWDPVPISDIDPSSEEYTSAHCDDTSDSNWKRIILFVFDTRTMESVACYMGDDQSCQDLGISSGTGSAAAPSDSDNPTGNGDLSSKSLAKLMLDNTNITYWTNNGVNTQDVVKKIAETGKGYTTSKDAYAVAHRQVEVNPNILRFILDLAKDHKIMVNALTDKDHGSDSNHYKGIAVDLDCGSDVDKAGLDSAASKYGGSNNGEVCPGNKHWHYDFPTN